MWPNFANMLSWWQWAILAAVPPAIIALYFLKLKRRPLEVPSTYLWHKSVEDLHVNAIWQRLRRNLLLLLQLLVILLAVLAVLRPSWRGMRLSGDRFIFLVDSSASMQATDVDGSRLDEVKRQAAAMIDQLDSGDKAMIISFADAARVEQAFTDDRRRLRRALEGIVPTQRSTSLIEALRCAAGLANPGRSSQPGDLQDFQVADPLPAELFVFSDGKFESVTGFSLGNLKPTFVPVGDPEAANVGIVAFSLRRKQSRADLFQAFARLENFGSEDATVSLELTLDDRLIDADQLDLPAGEARGVAFDLGAVEAGVLALKAATGDDLALDDEAWAVIRPPRRANVLLVTPGNEPLELALDTSLAAEIAEVTVEDPEFINGKAYRNRALGGEYDLVIFDRCAPKQMPQANTAFVGSLPPVGGWSAGKRVAAPQIIDVEATHPLLQWIELGDVILAEATPLKVPPGGSLLVDSDAGPLMAVVSREGFEDAVLAFTLIEEVVEDGKPVVYNSTNWHFKQSFPVFIVNLLDYLGGSRGLLGSQSARPGSPVGLEGPAARAKLRVRSPSGKQTVLEAGKLGKFSYTDTAELGVYQVQSGGKTLQRFAVNLFNRSESAIRPRPNPSIKIGYVEVAAKSGWEVARREIWRPLLLAGLAVLLLEWYIYSRRVHL